MQQLREKKSSGCKLMKMKIPAASCNLLLLFLFFIFCHLDLCSSLRLIGDPSKLPHVALRTDEVECNNTVQGRYLLSDSRGYVCSIMAVNSATSCCPEVGKQYSCHGCELVSRCCDSYEYCVACCMDPAWTVVEVALKTKVAKQATARTCSSLFEFCSGRCRHNSQSVVHENAYANELHHCFSEQLNRSGESGDSAVETKLTDLTIIAARQGQSCDAACKGRRLSCAADKLSEINNCSELQSYMKCRGLCIASSGPDQPAEVVSTAPKHLILEDINKEDMAMLCMCIAAIYAAYFTHGIVQENVSTIRYGEKEFQSASSFFCSSFDPLL